MTVTEYSHAPFRLPSSTPSATLRPYEEDSAAAGDIRPSEDPFFWTIRFLPEPRRQAMYALYWFWHDLRGIAGGEASDLLKQALLSDWRGEIARLYDGRPRLGVTRSLVEPVRRYGLKCDDFLTVIQGLEADARNVVQAPGLEELDLHGAQVGVALCRLAARILGLDEPAAERFASAFGRGANLTWILHDMHADAARNRLYLPRELLEAHGMRSLSPRQAMGHSALALICAELAAMAEAHFAAAAEAVAACRSPEARVADLVLGSCRGILRKTVALGWQQPVRPVRLSVRHKTELLLRYGLANARSLLRPQVRREHHS